MGFIKKNKLKSMIGALSVSFFYTFNYVFANGFKTPISFTTFEGFLTGLINAVITILTPIIVLMFVYTGFLFLKAQGNPGEITKARTALMWSFIGAMVVLGAWALSHAIVAILEAL